MIKKMALASLYCLSLSAMAPRQKLHEPFTWHEVIASKALHNEIKLFAITPALAFGCFTFGVGKVFDESNRCALKKSAKNTVIFGGILASVFVYCSPEVKAIRAEKKCKKLLEDPLMNEICQLAYIQQHLSEKETNALDIAAEKLAQNSQEELPLKYYHKQLYEKIQVIREEKITLDKIIDQYHYGYTRSDVFYSRCRELDIQLLDLYKIIRKANAAIEHSHAYRTECEKI